MDNKVKTLLKIAELSLLIASPQPCFFLCFFFYLFIFEFFNILFSWRDDCMLNIDFLNDCGPVSGIQTSLLIITK